MLIIVFFFFCFIGLSFFEFKGFIMFFKDLVREMLDLDLWFFFRCLVDVWVVDLSFK